MINERPSKMTFHEIRITVDADADENEWRQRIIDAVPVENYVDAYRGVITIKTPHIVETVEALKIDGFDM